MNSQARKLIVQNSCFKVVSAGKLSPWSIFLIINCGFQPISSITCGLFCECRMNIYWIFKRLPGECVHNVFSCYAAAAKMRNVIAEIVRTLLWSDFHRKQRERSVRLLYNTTVLFFLLSLLNESVVVDYDPLSHQESGCWLHLESANSFGNNIPVCLYRLFFKHSKDQQSP